MSETIAGKKTYTLLDLAESIQRMFSAHFNRMYWVKAEMNKLNHYTQSGHCYPELLQKENGKTVVEFKSTLWKNDYERINRLFLEQVKEPLKDGIKVLCQVSVSYTPQHGLSLRIHDIDISYTLGDIEAEKKEAIEQLKREGIFQLNKSKEHALLPKRIAVISVESSKGFADFQEIIDAQNNRFSIFRMLFPALLQGDKAIDSLLEALQRIQLVSHHFDAVAIIRGGGGEVGLSCFNNYRLARAIATFPIPVYTGIGHSTNETVCEMVSYYNGITPTKVAQQILDQFEFFAESVSHAQNNISRKATEMIVAQRREIHLHSRILHQATSAILGNQNQKLHNLQSELEKTTSRRIAFDLHQLESIITRTSTAGVHHLSVSRERLHQIVKRLSVTSSHVFSQSRSELIHLERIVTMANPQNILLRGYSISTLNGYPLRETSNLKTGDVIVTQLAAGVIESEVTRIVS